MEPYVAPQTTMCAYCSQEQDLFTAIRAYMPPLGAPAGLYGWYWICLECMDERDPPEEDGVSAASVVRARVPPNTTHKQRTKQII